LVAVTIFLFARDKENTVANNRYPHGELTCMQGDGGGTILFLRQTEQCPAKVPNLRLEAYLRDPGPIRAHKSMVIGEVNLAFYCEDPNGSCRQFASGTVVFDHYHQPGKHGTDRTDGSYEFRATDGRIERGRFTVNCGVQCG
jgi:hypothetical protein